MNSQSLSFDHIMNIADVWYEMGGAPKIEIGALEPLLWRDKQYRISHVIKALTERGFKVSMTTNGQLLDVFVKDLSYAGLSLIRTSWHSTDSLLFKEISGGHGDYNRFINGITLALESGIKLDFNRILFNGYTDDLLEQLLFIERYKSRLKLYTLMWTPQSAITYHKFFKDWRSVVRLSVLPRTAKIIRVKKQISRSRLRFHLTKGGVVEVKLGDKISRNAYPCLLCSFKNKCEEYFGDYVRIDPNLNLYFCYMRRDIGFSIQNYFGRAVELKQKIQEILGHIDVKDFLVSSSLRLTVTPFCNFNCRAPGINYGWCMEKINGYIYPEIKSTLLS